MFEVSRSGAVNILRGNDPINIQNEKQLSQLLDGCVVNGQPRIVFDLERVPLIDSAGLELLLDYQDRCLQRGGLLKLSAPNQLCRDILSVTKVDARLEVFPDSLAAIGSFIQ